MGVIDVNSSIIEERKREVNDYFLKQEAKTSTKLATTQSKKAELAQLETMVDVLRTELNVYVEPKWDKPMGWMQYCASELNPGDGIRIEDSGVLHTYIYVQKMSWWRSKTANILIHHRDNPDRRKRIGENDFVFGYKGYMSQQQLAKMGIDF